MSDCMNEPGIHSSYIMLNLSFLLFKMVDEVEGRHYAWKPFQSIFIYDLLD